MEEKKLNDEEYIKILAHCTGLQACHNCEYNDDCPIDNEKTVDLIHRLQDENAEQKAEIERLKSACECFQEMIISMQCRANNGKGVMVIYEVEQKKDGE